MAQQPVSLNLDSAYASVKAEMLGGRGSVVCIGDSLTFREGGFWENFREIVQQQYGDGGFGYQAMSEWTGAIEGSHGWIQGRINADSAPHWSLDGMWISSPYWNRGAVTFAMQDSTVRLHYVMQPAGGSMTLIQPGTPGISTEELLGTIETSGDNDVAVFERTFGEGELPRVRFYTQAAGDVVILGADNISGLPGPRVHRVANGGWGIDEFLRRNWTFDRQFAMLEPDLAIIMLGQNNPDFSSQGFADAMGELVTRLRASVPGVQVVLVSSYDSGSPILGGFADSLRQLASARSLGYIDLFNAGGTYQFFLLNQYLDPDGLHFSPAGGHYVAQLIFDALESGGASLSTAPCGDIDFNNDTSVFDPEDISDFLEVYSEGECSTGNCDTIDFNHDGGVYDPADIDTFLRVFSEGPCQL